MSRSPKTTGSKTGGSKKAPAKRSTAKPRQSAAKTPSRAGTKTTRRPPSKRAPAKRKTTGRRSGGGRRGLMMRVGLGAAGMTLLLLAVLTISWPGSGPSETKVAETKVEGPVKAAVASAAPSKQPAKAPETKSSQSSTTSKQESTAKADPPAKPASADAQEPKTELASAPPQTQPQPPAATKGTPAWKRYAVPYSVKPGQPMIAIVLDDIGPAKQRAENAINLPGPLTLAFLPYADDLPAMTARARKRGHELLIHVPMEPKDLAHNDPGKNALLTSLSNAEIRQRLDWAMHRFPAFVGINNHMGSAFTADRAKMDVVMQGLAPEGALFLDSMTSGGSQGETAAKAAGIPTVARDIFLDHYGNDPGLVLKQLAKVEALAKKRGYAIAIGHPHDGTVTALELWIPDAISRGFALVPISALVEAPQQSGL